MPSTSTVTEEGHESGHEQSSVTLVDPRAPRFGQALTTLGLLAGIVLQAPVLIAAVAVVLNAALFSGWRVDLYAYLWRSVMIPIVGPPAETEPAAPHRFAKLMGAGFTGVATLLLVADIVIAPPQLALGLSAVALIAYLLAGLVTALAGVAAITDICLGCRMYRQVSFFRRLDVV